MSAATRPSVYTIAPEAAFADALAKGLIDRTGGDPMVLARAQILLPSRRAVRALTDAFVRCADGGLLLPRMTPLGDIDVDDALDLVAGLETNLLPPIDPIRRRLLLTRLIRRWRDSIGSVEALRLADQLGASFDTLAREGVDPARLRDVAKDDLASHWLETFAFFELVIEHWPAILAAEGCSDRAARGNALLGIIAAHWEASPPPGLVVAAGMNGATPAQAALLGAIARLPDGMLVLPGLDVAMPADAWDSLVTDATGDETRRNSEEHPQYGLKRLLDDIGVARAEVENWPADAGSCATRATAVARALCPAQFTADWRAQPVAADDFDGVAWVEAEDAAAEAHHEIGPQARQPQRHDRQRPHAAMQRIDDGGLDRFQAEEIRGPGGRRRQIHADDHAPMEPQPRQSGPVAPKGEAAEGDGHQQERGENGREHVDAAENMRQIDVAQRLRDDKGEDQAGTEDMCGHKGR